MNTSSTHTQILERESAAHPRSACFALVMRHLCPFSQDCKGVVRIRGAVALESGRGVEID